MFMSPFRMLWIEINKLLIFISIGITPDLQIVEMFYFARLLSFNPFGNGMVASSAQANDSQLFFIRDGCRSETLTQKASHILGGMLDKSCALSH